METRNQQVHIILAHGACHGAWCWYKLKPLLEAAGHRVTALDMAASGIDSRSLHELRSLADYTQPLLELMASIPAEEKVVLVGHSFGGMNLGLAMDMPSSLFLEDLSKKSAFSKEGFGSVKRVYIVCTQDKAILVNFQRWQIETIGVNQVMEIETADHMPMLSQPHELCQCLLDIANNYV
ncbi:hypothetical protein DH2020_050061 [Rehmannia glutinosa]|uniref:AB hydrolase-1 domain-containing protein n=1 Tax=Rehmannia glutinosa TaxID=99300 RepID=A0ABR0U152_REHGL